LHGEPADPPPGDAIPRAHSRVEVQLAFIFDVSQLYRLVLLKPIVTNAPFSTYKSCNSKKFFHRYFPSPTKINGAQKYG
jgi:hypothetical protein